MTGWENSGFLIANSEQQTIAFILVINLNISNGHFGIYNEDKFHAHLS